MLQRFLFIALTLCSLTASAQWQQTGSKVRYVNGLGIPTRDTAAGVAADSSQILIRPADSSLYIKYKRTWVKVGSGGTIGGSGTTNYIPKFTSSTAIGNSQIFDNGTNVGIGTASPAAALDVRANSGIVVGSVGRAFIRQTVGGDAEMGCASGGYLSIFSDGSEKMRIISSGNVGIGTTSPAVKLDVNGGINLASGNSLTWGGVYGANIPTIAALSGAGAYLAFYPAGSTSGEKMRITAAGNTLIGTTTDNGTDRLQVSGSVNVSTNIKVGTYLISSYNNEILAGVDAAGYYFANGASGTSNIPINFGDRASYIGFKTSPSTAAGIEKMRITSSGRILMGAILPTDNGVDALQVSGSVNVSTLATTNNLSVTTNATVGGTLRVTGSTTLGTTTTGAITASSIDAASGNATFGNIYSNGIVQMLGVNVKYRNISATYTATTSDDYFINITSGTFTLNLPTAATPFGQVYVIKNSGTGTVTVDPSGTQTIDGATTFAINVQNQSITIIGDGSNWKIVSKYL